MITFFSADAPAAIGPYSQAMRTGQLLYCSGQTPIHAASTMIEAVGIEAQTVQAIRNLEAVLYAAGLTLTDIVKTNVYLSDMSHFSGMNTAYAACFGAHRPARTTVAVKGLPYHALVEIECIATFDNISSSTN